VFLLYQLAGSTVCICFSIADQIVEAMHALLGALVDATASQDVAEQQLVLSMLGHRDELMERMRRRVLQENPDLPVESKRRCLPRRCCSSASYGWGDEAPC
jgi:hypothetical protein